MQLQPKTFCASCYARVEYRLTTATVELSVRDVIFSYQEVQAFCKDCGAAVYVPAVNDKNVYERHKAYYEALTKLCEEKIQNGNLQEKVSA